MQGLGVDAVDLHSNDFELMGLPERFAIDRAQLDERWKALQKQSHPDQFAREGAAAQRLAMQWSVRINEAYQRLKDPLARAAYLCRLRGQDVEAERNTAMPAAFLMQQMAWREALEEAEAPEALERLAAEVQQTAAQTLTRVQAELDGADPLGAARAVHEVRALMFIERLRSEVDAKIDRLHEAG